MSNLSQFQINNIDAFKDFIKQQPGLVVIDFFAPWCGPCQRLLKILPRIANEFPDVTFVEVNAEEMTEIRKLYTFFSYPTIYFVKQDGDIIQKYGSISGAYVEKIREKCQQFKDPLAIPEQSVWDCMCRVI